MSSLDNLPLSFVTVISSLLPLDFSTAETFSIPSALTSYVISICGTPRGIGGILDKLNSPSLLLCFVNFLSPSNT